MAVLRAAGAGVHPRVAWWRDLPPLAVGYAAYACVRDLRGRDTSAVAYRVAEQHALSLRAVEQRLGIAIEGGLQARESPRLVLLAPESWRCRMGGPPVALTPT